MAAFRKKLVDRLKISFSATGSITGSKEEVPPGLKGVAFFEITDYGNLTNLTLDLQTGTDMVDRDDSLWSTAATSGTQAGNGSTRDNVGDPSAPTTQLGDVVRWKASATGSGTAVISITLIGSN